MEVKIEIKSIFGNVLFEFSKENNTIKDTIIEAVKRDAYLHGANLRGAYKITSVDDILLKGGICKMWLLLRHCR